MNIPEDADITDMGWDGTKTEKGVSWKLHNDLDPSCPQEGAVDDVKGTSMPDVSASGVLQIHGPAKEIAGTGSPILDRMALGKLGKKKSFADIARS